VHVLDPVHDRRSSGHKDVREQEGVGSENHREEGQQAQGDRSGQFIAGGRAGWGFITGLTSCVEN